MTAPGGPQVEHLHEPPFAVRVACFGLALSLICALAACSLPFEREVVVRADGSERLERTSAATVGAALIALGITLGPLDRVVPPADQAVGQGLRISVIRGVARTREVTETTAVPTEVSADHGAADGLIVSASPGTAGLQRVTYREYWEEGILVRREIAATQVLTPPIAARLTIGDRRIPQLDAFEQGARSVLSQPGASRLSAAGIEASLAELAQRQPGSRIKVVHHQDDGTFPFTLVSFTSFGEKPVLLAFWWPERPTSASQRLAEGVQLLDHRLVQSDPGWELGLFTSVTGVGGAAQPVPRFWLFRLASGRWIPVWSSVQTPSWSMQPGQATFANGGLDQLIVTEQMEVPPIPIFLECPACAHRQARSVWTRQGDGYYLEQRRAIGSPYAVLWDFLVRLRAGDETGASALAADPSVVPIATGLGLDVPGVTWSTSSRSDSQVIDFAGAAGAFRATLQPRGGTWRVVRIARASSEGRILFTESSRGVAGRIVSFEPNYGEPLLLQSGTRYSWSPDYQMMAYEAGGQICVASSVGTRHRCLLTGASPVWSPLADGLLVERAGAGGTEIWQVSVDGNATVALASGTSPAWSPDGTRIAFSASAGPSTDSLIALMRPDGSEQIVFTTDGRSPAWSADGRQLAFITSADLIVAIDVATAAITPIGSGQSLRWSPRGQTLALIDAGQLRVVTLGRPPRQVGPWADVLTVSWSPDGSRMVVGRSNHEIWLVGSDGTNLRKLADGTAPVWASVP